MKRFLSHLPAAFAVIMSLGVGVFLHVSGTQAAPQVIPQQELASLIGSQCGCGAALCPDDRPATCAYDSTAGTGAPGCHGCDPVTASYRAAHNVCTRNNAEDVFGCCGDEPPCENNGCHENECGIQQYVSEQNCEHIQGSGECAEAWCNYPALTPLYN